MHHVRFDEATFTGDELLLSGRFLHARVTLVEGGAWRLLFYSRLEDAQKGSWVVRPQPRLPFSAAPGGGGYTLEAPAVPALRLTLDPFTLSWGEGPEGRPLLHASSMQARRTRLMGDPRQMKLLATGQGDPLAESVDGQPFGAGLSLTLDDPPERRYYGLGERTGFLDKRGRVWTNWATDQSRHTPHADPLYLACPFVMGLERGVSWGMYLDESWRTVFDLAASEPDRSVVHADGPTFDVYLISGPSPRQVVEGLTALTGRPSLPPLWALGYHQCRWSYPSQDAVEALAREFAAREIPLDALWLDIDYMDGYKVFSFSPGRFPAPEAMTSALAERGVRTVAIVDPGVKQEAGYDAYESGLSINAFVRDRREQLLTGEVWPSPAVWPDFTRPEVRAWWGDLCRFYADRGLSGLWLDMNEPSAFNWEGKTLPEGARHGKRWHAEVHNLYGQLMCQATHEAVSRHAPERRPFLLTRSGFAGVQRHAFVWTGDNASYWEHLEMSLPMLLNMGLSGVAFAGADVGGFSEDATGELLVRWLWAGALYPFMRNHAGKGTRRQEPWAFGEPFTAHAREAISFRYRLLPLLYTLAREACLTGAPVLRPLLFEHPGDAECELVHDQLLVGRDLMAAPIVRPGQTRRLCYLPEGAWHDFWTGERHEGGGHIVARAGLDRLPLFVRQGGAIPLGPAALHTTGARWGSLLFRCAPGPQIAADVYEDDGDGHAPGAVNELRGSLGDDSFEVELTGPASARAHVAVELLGLGAPSWCSTSFKLTGRGVEIALAAGKASARW